MSQQPLSQESHWMIRKKNNHLIGPLAQNQVKQMVESGLLEAEDELCVENGYWFLLSETEEVRKQLGLENVFIRREQEDTETTVTTDTADTVTDEIVAAQGDQTLVFRAPQTPIPHKGLSQSQVAHLQAKPAPSADQLTQQFKRPSSAIIGFPFPEQVIETSRRQYNIEKSKVWSFVVFIATIIVGVGLFVLIQLLRRKGI